MKTTKTFADITTDDYLAHLNAGDINGYPADPYNFSSPYPKVTSVGPYSDGVHTFVRIHFYDSQWRMEYVATRLPGESLIVSDVETDPPVPTITEVSTTLTYSDDTTVTYTCVI